MQDLLKHRPTATRWKRVTELFSTSLHQFKERDSKASAMFFKSASSDDNRLTKT
jgi:hypothetical protein